MILLSVKYSNPIEIANLIREKFNDEENTQVADKLGISEKYISRLENGNSGVKLETLINYMNTLGIAPDVLFKDLMRNNDVVFQVNLSQKISELPKERQRFINKIVDELKRL